VRQLRDENVRAVCVLVSMGECVRDASRSGRGGGAWEPAPLASAPPPPPPPPLYRSVPGAVGMIVVTLAAAAPPAAAAGGILFGFRFGVDGALPSRRLSRGCRSCRSSSENRLCAHLPISNEGDLWSLISRLSAGHRSRNG
jgi:hypothetical protein